MYRLFCSLAERFPGGKLVFDATNAKGLKNMRKTWLKSAEMENVGLYFSVEDESNLASWSERFASVTRKGYMTGYRNLDKRYGLLANAAGRDVWAAAFSSYLPFGNRHNVILPLLRQADHNIRKAARKHILLYGYLRLTLI